MRKIILLVAALSLNTVFADNNKDIFNEINKIRIKNGSKPLVYDKKLETVATEWAINMSKEDSFRHRSNLNMFLTTYKSISENLFYSTRISSPTSVIYAWRNSNAHYEIMIDDEINVGGIGTYYDGKRYYVVFNGGLK